MIKTTFLAVAAAISLSACSTIQSSVDAVGSGLNYVERGVEFATFGFIHNHDSGDADHNHNTVNNPIKVDTATVPRAPQLSPVLTPLPVPKPVSVLPPVSAPVAAIQTVPIVDVVSQPALPPLIAITNPQTIDLGPIESTPYASASNCICPR